MCSTLPWYSRGMLSSPSLSPAPAEPHASPQKAAISSYASGCSRSPPAGSWGWGDDAER